MTRLGRDPSHGVYPANSPRAGRQQGYAGSGGCAGGPSRTAEREAMAGDVPSPAPAEPARRGAPTAPTALYRRDRPATFAELNGQDHVTEPLPQALPSGRGHHTYLFSAPPRAGTTRS